jgi:hypothetical protein
MRMAKLEIQDSVMFKNVLIDTYKIIPSFPKRILETENWPKIVQYRGCNNPDDKSSTAAENPGS